MSSAGNYFMSTVEEAFAVTASVPGWGSGLDLAAKGFCPFQPCFQMLHGTASELSLQHFPGFPLKYLLLYSNTFSEYLDLTHIWSLNIFNSWKSIAISKVSLESPRLVPLGGGFLLLCSQATQWMEETDVGAVCWGLKNGMRWHLEYRDPVNLWGGRMEMPSWDFASCAFAGRIDCLSFTMALACLHLRAAWGGATCAMWRPKVAAKKPCHG